MADDFFLSRWSRRKTLARRGETPPEPKKRQRPRSFEGKEGRLRERG